MSTALAETLQDQAALNDAFTLEEGVMDAHVRQAIARMVEWCQKQPQAAEFLARGFVVDTVDAWGENDESTLLRIAQQIRGYFPASIDVSPVIDDMAFVAVAQAKISNQRFQELELSYVGDGKVPDAAKANTQSYVKWYSAENVLGADAQGNHKTLKPGWGGGAGGDGASLMKHLGLATKKGFLLQVRALDITDTKARTLLANMDIVQAFGGSPEALKEAIETIAKGGPEAAQLKAVITQIVEIKTLRQALANAGDTPAAAPIAAALAIKTEALSAQLVTIKAPVVVKTAIGQTVEIVKTDLQARQIESVITTLSQTVARPSPAHMASTDSPRVIMIAQIARAVQSLQVAARTQNVPVRDMIATVLTKSAPPEVVAQVKGISEILAKPDFLPTIEKAVQPAAALSIRTALTTPVLQAVAQKPISLPAVARSMAAAGVKTDVPTLKTAAAIVADVAQANKVERVTPSLRAPMLQSVVENLQAVVTTRHVPEAAKPAIIVAAAQVEAVTVQVRQPAPQPLPAQPQALPAQTPLEAVAKAVDVKAPEIIPPAAPKVAEAQQAIIAETQRPPAPPSIEPRIAPAPVNDAKPTSPDSKAPVMDMGKRDAAAFVPGHQQQQQQQQQKQKTEEKQEAGCGGKVCSKCFNKTCQALSAEKVAAITSDIKNADTNALRAAYEARRAAKAKPQLA